MEKQSMATLMKSICLDNVLRAKMAISPLAVRHKYDFPSQKMKRLHGSCGIFQE